jgi:hypothetical protein
MPEPDCDFGFLTYLKVRSGEPTLCIRLGHASQLSPSEPGLNETGATFE